MDDFDFLMRFRLQRYRLPDRVGERAVRAAAFIADTTEDNILSQDRRRRFSHPRQAAMYALHRKGWTVSRIGRLFGRDHTTTIYACRQVEQDPKRRAMAEDIAGLLE